MTQHLTWAPAIAGTISATGIDFPGTAAHASDVTPQRQWEDQRDVPYAPSDIWYPRGHADFDFDFTVDYTNGCGAARQLTFHTTHRFVYPIS